MKEHVPADPGHQTAAEDDNVAAQMTSAEIRARVRELTRGRRSLVEDIGRSSLGPTGEMSKRESDFLVKLVKIGLQKS